ncbi:omptin family outer membrane protease [Legionella rowbothamii]|uniref:omptin family outer membrane protease n=1 Tax=Legionella rowbothamii TaxID=96229 RepID=UPI001054EADF|nr:omptin family outer membrane protease [Legionella rowbothamii]
MKKKWLQLTLSTLAIATSTTYAASTSLTDRFTLNASIGYLAGKSQEFVYNDGGAEKVSQLNWKINGAAVIKGEGNYKLLPWLDFNAQGWITLADGDAVMDDYDWLNPFQRHWSDWSHSKDTDLRQANEFDFNLRARFFKLSSVQLAAMVGYQRTLFSFLAKGGCYIYNDGMDVGCFPEGEKGIGYKQTFSTPYIGILGNYRINAYELNALFKYSSWVTAKDVDQHYMRDLTFHDGGHNFEFYNVTVNAGYYIRPQIKLFTEGSFSYVPNKIADTNIRDNVTSEETYIPASAGLNNKNMVLSVGIQYKGMAG